MDDSEQLDRMFGIERVICRRLEDQTRVREEIEEGQRAFLYKGVRNDYCNSVQLLVISPACSVLVWELAVLVLSTMTLAYRATLFGVVVYVRLVRLVVGGGFEKSVGEPIGEFGTLGGGNAPFEVWIAGDV